MKRGSITEYVVLPAVPLERGDVFPCVSRLRNSLASDYPDGHLVEYGEGLCDDVSAVELVADDARTDGVSVEADEQVE